MTLLRPLLILAAAAALGACGFHLRGEAKLPAGMQRVHLTVADPYSPLKRDLEAALTRSGASIVAVPGDGVSEIAIPALSLAPIVRSVGANAILNEFSMVYHVEIEISGPDGKLLLPRQTIEHAREFTFDQTQAIGTSAEQDEIKKEMERDMVQAVLRKIEAVERKLGG
jgi:LPS-assembly lipoprotein